MPTETMTVKLPADNSLTSEQFTVNADGSLTVKNKEIADYLSKRLVDAVNDPQNPQSWVGVIWG